MMSGGAVQLACQAVKKDLFARVRRWAQAEGGPWPEPLTVEGGMVLAAGESLAPIEEFLETPIEQTRVYHHRPTTPIDEKGQGEPHVSFGLAAERAVVGVDEDLGLVRVVQVAAGRGVERVEGIPPKDGLIKIPSFTGYLSPTILDKPPVVSELIEEPEPGVP